MITLHGNHRLEGFERLQRPFEADRSRCHHVFAGCLGHDGSDQIVGQYVRPDFLANQLRGFATQTLHLHDRFD